MAQPAFKAIRPDHIIGVGQSETPSEIVIAQNQASSVGTAINDAMAALGSVGGTVTIPAGTWTIDTPILVSKSGVIIRGQSAGQTLLQFNGASVSPAIQMVDTTQRHGVLRDFRLESTSDGSGVAINAAFFTNWIMQNLRIGNTGAAPNKGILFQTSGTFYNAVRDCRVQVKGAGSVAVTFTANAQSNLVSNLRVLGDTTNATGVLVDAHSNKLERVDAETNCLIGIDITAAGHSCLVDHPYLEGNGTGLRVANGVKSAYVLGGFIADNPAGGANNIVNSAAAGELQYRAVRLQFNTANL